MREVQKQVLLEIEAAWDGADVLVISAPTATGKSALAKCILDWCGSAIYLAPTNLLIQQFLTEFPDTRSLHRLDSYQCTGAVHRSCASMRGSGAFCRGCPASQDLAWAKYRTGPLVCNYHTYVAQKLSRPVLVVDEAHNLIPHIQGMSSIRQWKHRPPQYPSGDPATLRRWLSGMSGQKRSGKFAAKLDDALNSEFPQFVLEEKWEEWKGGGQQSAEGESTRRGDSQELPCVRLTPTDIRDLPAIRTVLPAGVKLVLLSATIGVKDIQQLGLDRRRVVYINCKSPIPVENRPVLFQPVATVSRSTQEHSTAALGQYVEENLLPHHRGEKGILHCTYQQAAQLRAQFTDPRFLFHSRDPREKAQVYAAFRDSAPEEGKVLVACGMHEGLDLPDDYGRWQVVMKVPWKSLGNRAISVKAEQDPEWYAWECLKTLIQACGRISRNEEDYGVTYLVDSSFRRLLDTARHLMPEWFRQALIE